MGLYCGDFVHKCREQLLSDLLILASKYKKGHQLSVSFYEHKWFCFSNLIKTSFKIYELGLLISHQVSVYHNYYLSQATKLSSHPQVASRRHMRAEMSPDFDFSLSYSSASCPQQSLDFLWCALGISVDPHHGYYLEQVTIVSWFLNLSPQSIISINDLFAMYNENYILHVIFLPRTFQSFLM